MNVLGMGILGTRGRGVDAFRQALTEGWREPAAANSTGGRVPVYGVDLERIQDKAVLRKLRRADKLSKMAVLAAMDAVDDSGLTESERNRLGVIVATAFGAHVTTFEFLDGVLDFGEAAVSPTVFSNSVHNAAASYISTALGIQGPTLTITRFFFPVQAALQLASAWLKEGRMENVLVGAVDQIGAVMAYIMDAKRGIAQDGKIRPFATRTGTVPGEGAAFFVLSSKYRDRAYCVLEDVSFGSAAPLQERPNLEIVDLDGLSDGLPGQAAAEGGPLAAYAPIYGSMMIGSGFSLAAAALMIRDQVMFDNPVQDNPAGLPVLVQRPVSSVDFIRCIRYNCESKKSTMHLRKP